GVVAPSAGGHGGPGAVLAGHAHFHPVLGDDTVGHGVTGLITQGVQHGGLSQLQLNPALLRAVLQILAPLGVPEGVGVVVHSEGHRALVAGLSLSGGGSRSGLGVVVVTAAIGGIVVGGAADGQVDGVGATGGVVLRLGEDLHHVVVGGDDGVGNVVAVVHFQGIHQQSLGVIGAGSQLAVVPGLAVDGDAGEGVRAVDGEAGLSQVQLHLGEADAVRGSGGSGIALLVGDRDAEVHGILGLEGVGDAGDVGVGIGGLTLGDVQGGPLNAVAADFHLHIG